MLRHYSLRAFCVLVALLTPLMVGAASDNVGANNISTTTGGRGGTPTSGSAFCTINPNGTVTVGRMAAYDIQYARKTLVVEENLESSIGR